MKMIPVILGLKLSLCVNCRNGEPVNRIPGKKDKCGYMPYVQSDTHCLSVRLEEDRGSVRATMVGVVQ